MLQLPAASVLPLYIFSKNTTKSDSEIKVLCNIWNTQNTVNCAYSHVLPHKLFQQTEDIWPDNNLYPSATLLYKELKPQQFLE